MIQAFHKINKVKGTLSFRGDKSISHRALLISSLAKGNSYIRNLSESEDVKSTMKCLNSLGILIENNSEKCIVSGRGFGGYQKPLNQLNAGNSGTTARLLSGILAAQNFESSITGDESLSGRPMKRVIEPLTNMGANIGSKEGNLPINILPAQNLKSIKYTLPIPSAQVKSAILLAGLHLDDQTSVVESISTRNHTENLLGLKILKEENKTVSMVSKNNYPEAQEYFIPGDISSAMFFIVLTLLTEKSELLIKDISLNATRIECLKLFNRMGADFQLLEKGISNNEVYGDIVIKSSDLFNVNIEKEIIPLIIDEIPILTIAGIFAEGVFEIRGATELRVKESDRIKAICTNLIKLGLDVEEHEDGFTVLGKVNKRPESFNSFGDHRIAMTLAILSSLLESGGNVQGFESAAISNPNFIDQLKSIAY